MTERPEVTLLLPVHNAERTLDAALHDVCAQKGVSMEALVVLNGVEDRSQEIAHAWAERDPRITILTSPIKGIVPALNLGIDRAQAPLIARFDADDRMAPERLARQVEAMRAHPDWALSTTQVKSSGLDEGPAGPGMTRLVDRLNRLTTPEAIRAARFVDVPVVHPAVMFRRDIVRDLGGYKDGHFGEDHELWLRMLERGHTFGMVEEVLVTWRDHGERMTRTDPKLVSQRALRGLVARYLLRGPLAQRSCRVWGAGKCGKGYIKALHEAGAQVDDIIDIDPAKVGRTMAHGLEVVAADTLGPPDGRLILSAVAAPGASGLIAGRLQSLGYQVERDWLPLR